MAGTGPAVAAEFDRLAPPAGTIPFAARLDRLSANFDYCLRGARSPGTEPWAQALSIQLGANDFEHVVEHVFGKPAGIGVVARAVIAVGQHGIIG